MPSLAVRSHTKTARRNIPPKIHVASAFSWRSAKIAELGLVQNVDGFMIFCGDLSWRIRFVILVPRCLKLLDNDITQIR